MLFWVSPLASSVIFLLATAFSFLRAPNSSATWQDLADSGDTLKGGAVAYNQTDRNWYRGFKLTVWILVCGAEVWLLRLKRRRRAGFQPCQPHLALTQLVFNLYRVALAHVEMFLLIFVPADVPWVNPGLGMFGWSSAFGLGFPRVADLTDAAHVGLAVTSAVGLHVVWLLPEAGRKPGLQPWLLRFLKATGLGLAFWYPIYDSKHWYGGSHLGNLGGEFLPIYALITAVLESCRELRDQRLGQPVLKKSWTFSRWLDRFQAAMVVLALAKFLFDLGRSGGTWGRPSTYPSDGSVPPDMAVMIGSFNLTEEWKSVVVFGINLGGMILLFLISEVLLCVYDEDSDSGSSCSSAEEPSDHTLEQNPNGVCS